METMTQERWEGLWKGFTVWDKIPQEGTVGGGEGKEIIRRTKDSRRSER